MRRAFLLASLASALAACASPVPPPAPAPKAAPKPAPKPVETAAASSDQPAFVYAYLPSGKRDPFRSPLEDLAAEHGGAGLISSTACSAPLCRWDLDQLKLVGVISGMSNPMAMVEDPAGIGYVVRRNSFMGKKGGRVTQIKHDAVVVTEIVRGGDGKPHPNEIPLHMTPDTTSSNDQNLLQGGSAE